MTIFLVGVDHRIQWIPKHLGPESAAELEEFSEYLAHISSDNEITLIAEEFSEEALEKSNAIDSVARRASAKAGVQHLFCDPTTQERQASGISTSCQREQLWLNRLTSAPHHRIVFICGEDHLESFSARLNMAGHQTNTLSSGWGKG